MRLANPNFFLLQQNALVQFDTMKKMFDVRKISNKHKKREFDDVFNPNDNLCSDLRNLNIEALNIDDGPESDELAQLFALLSDKKNSFGCARSSQTPKKNENEHRLFRLGVILNVI